MIFMVWRTFEEYIEDGEIPVSFLERNPAIHAEDGDLPEGWYFYDMREQDGADAGGYIVQGGPNMATQKKPHFTLRSKPKPQLLDTKSHSPSSSIVGVMRISDTVKLSAVEPENWSHKDDMIYRLVSGHRGMQRPLNWNLFPTVLIGDF